MTVGSASAITFLLVIKDFRLYFAPEGKASQAPIAPNHPMARQKQGVWVLPNLGSNESVGPFITYPSCKLLIGKGLPKRDLAQCLMDRIGFK